MFSDVGRETPLLRRTERPFKKKQFIFLYLGSIFLRQHKNSGLPQAFLHSDFFVQMLVTEEPTKNGTSAPNSAASQASVHRKVFWLLQMT